MSLPNEKMVQKNYNVRAEPGKGVIKLWNKHVTIEEAALKQLDEVSSMPFVKPWVAAMPDTHFGMGATVGSVIPTEGAVMPAAVGVDIGCGMMAVRTNLKIPYAGNVQGNSLQDNLREMYEDISKAVPHGRTDNGGANDIGAWPAYAIPDDIRETWNTEIVNLRDDYGDSIYSILFARHPDALSKNTERHLGTLGTGNHFIEVCIEIDNPDSNLWVVIHSGSRGFGNRIGTYFTKLAGELCKKWHINLPNKDLGYFPAGTQEYVDYLSAVDLAQRFAWVNRQIMMRRVLAAIGAQYHHETGPTFDTADQIPNEIHMHHNYMVPYVINGKTVNLTRKGAVDASEGNWVIIPGSMGAKTYIARGLGNRDSFWSCSHGAGRAMSRTEALKTFTVEQHAAATEGVYCDKTRAVLDETPAAYKSIDDVMESQKDLVEPVLKIKQLVCVKGLSD